MPWQEPKNWVLNDGPLTADDLNRTIRDNLSPGPLTHKPMPSLRLLIGSEKKAVATLFPNFFGNNISLCAVPLTLSNAEFEEFIRTGVSVFKGYMLAQIVFIRADLADQREDY